MWYFEFSEVKILHDQSFIQYRVNIFCKELPNYG